MSPPIGSPDWLIRCAVAMAAEVPGFADRLIEALQQKPPWHNKSDNENDLLQSEAE